MVQLRPAVGDDRTGLYEICLRTGNAGEDARGLYRHPDLLGHLYVGAYLALEPDLCLVVEDEEGIGGYVLGACDTVAFEEACVSCWWPPLQQRYPLSLATASPAERARLCQLHAPQLTPLALTGPYPAHLHINLLPRLQRQGWGRRLLDRFRDLAAKQGAKGLHLIVADENARACAFYRHYGFCELGRQQGAVAFGIATA
jgi:ribosomal protein S18 acetylase RimI-like enzyme